MALQKAVPTDFGVPATYWNIGAVQEDFRGKGTQVTLYGYVDAAARLGSKAPMAAVQFTTSGDKYVAGADRAALYGAIHASPEWADALAV